MCKVCTVQKVEGVFGSRWQREGFLGSVRQHQLCSSPHGGGERQTSLRPDDDRLVGKVDPAVGDEGGGPPLAVGQTDAGRLVTALQAEVTSGRH